MAKLCDAGHRINKSFNWTTIIKAAIDVACFFSAPLLVVSSFESCRVDCWLVFTLISKVVTVFTVCLKLFVIQLLHVFIDILLETMDFFGALAVI